MITQSLHSFLKIKNHKPRTKNVLFWFLVFVSYILPAQDSIVLESSISEKKQLQFQELFFNAITQKAINNPQNAIENLEGCNTLIPNNKAVLFELSKNYFQLHRFAEAEEYAKQALTQDKDNIWLLEHLVDVYKKTGAFEQAIAVQKEISKNHPKKKQELVYLHLQNNDTNNAKKVLAELTEAKLLNRRLRNIQKQLNKKSSAVDKKVVKNTSFVNDENLETLFKNTHSFDVLKKLLTKLDNENNPDLLTYSEQGVALFPAQPLVYLMNGRALIKNKAYKKALLSLQNGIDFVIDNLPLENRFFSEFIKAYEGLGDAKNANLYRKKVK